MNHSGSIKDLLAQCPHTEQRSGGSGKIFFDELDYLTKLLLETMCQGEFLKKDENQGWDLFEALAEKTIQWESLLAQRPITLVLMMINSCSYVY